METVKPISIPIIADPVLRNTNPKNQHIFDAQYCSQKVYEFALELDGKATVSGTLLLSCQNESLISTLKGYLGRRKVQFDGLADLDQVIPYIDEYAKKYLRE